MKKVKEFLTSDYRSNVSNLSERCIPFDKLSAYASGELSEKQKTAVEAHMAGCYHCLDTVLLTHDGVKDFCAERRLELKKEHLFLIMTLLCFVFSFIFSGYFIQLLSAAVILGVKWIIDSRSTKTLIMINKALRDSEEDDAENILRGTRSKKRMHP